MRKTGREKEGKGPSRNLCLSAQGHTIQQDRVLSIKRKTEKNSLGCWKVMCWEMKCWKVNSWKAKPRRILTRPGRLRAWSGSKLPTANVPLRALEDGVQKIEVRATFFAILRFGLTAIWFTATIFEKYDFAYDFLQKYRQIWGTTPGGTKNEKIERQGHQKWAHGHPKWAKGHQKWAKREPKGTKRDPKVSQREPKVTQRVAKGSPKWTKWLPKWVVAERSGT